MPFRELLRHDLIEARKSGDSQMVSLLRTIIAAIDNAEAVDPDRAMGATEVPRRHLTEEDVLTVVRDEGSDLRRAADEYELLGDQEEAARLRSLGTVADRYAEEFGRNQP